MKVPLIDLISQYRYIKDEIKVAIDEVIESQQFCLGEKVEQFEDEIAEYCNVKYSVGVASGSDALLLSLMALSIGYGDEVITTPFTFIATAYAISLTGATPIFVDIDAKTYNINPNLIEEKITDRTRAIIPVHLYGQCADMDPILKIGNKYNLCIIEDAAQAIGAEYKGRKAGSMGDLGCISFYPSKNLGGYGDSGVVMTKSEMLANRIKALRIHGEGGKNYYPLLGINGRMDAIQAAVLSVKLKYLDNWNDTRRKNAAFYNATFADLNIMTPYVDLWNEHVYYQYVIRTENRDNLMGFLNSKGIEVRVYYPIPLHLQGCYSNSGNFPITEKMAKETVALPVHPELTKEQRDYVVVTMQNYFKEAI